VSLAQMTLSEGFPARTW